MGSIKVEQRDIRVWERSEVVDTEVQIKNGIYTQIKKTNVYLNSELYSYEDLSVLCSFEENFSDTYLNIVLFNDEKQLAYKLLTLNAGLDVEIRRLTDKNFLIVGQNEKHKDCLGQVSFCELKEASRVNEKSINFSTLKKLAVISKKFVMVNLIEELEGMGSITAGDDKDKRIQYSHMVVMYSYDGKIIKTFVDERCDEIRNYDFKLIGSEMLVYHMDKGEKKVVSELDMATLVPNA